MKRVFITASSLLLLAIILMGCNIRSSQSHSVNSYDEFIAALKSKEYEVKEINLDEQGIAKHTFFSEYPDYIQLDPNDSWIAIYEFEDTETARQQAERISEDGYGIGMSDISWVAKPFFYQKNRLIVHHTSNEEKLLDDFEAILGKPIRQ